MGRREVKIMDTMDKKVNIYFGGTNPHDEDLECVCDKCDVKITEEEIEKHFLSTSQIYKFKNLKFNFYEISKFSEFSHALIMEKEKIKASELL